MKCAEFCICCKKSPCQCAIPELIQCPFCGGKNTIISERLLQFETKISFAYRVICKDCDLSGPPAESKIEAAERWNNRIPRKRLLTKIEHLEFEKNRFIDRAIKAEQMLYDQYAGKLSQEDIFEYVQEGLEKI